MDITAQITATVDHMVTNWDMWMAWSLAAIASMDKLFLIVIKTMANIRDAWRDSFGRQNRV